MTDIHTHVLPFVDDGSDSTDVSLDMLRTAKSQGVTDMVLTPHYRGEYTLTPASLKAAFEDFCALVKNAGIDINLYLGQEIFIDGGFKKLFAENAVLTMSGTSQVLIEFDYEVDCDIAEIVYELKLMGFVPVIAHFERYSYADISVAREIKSLGGYIQVNADSLVGKTKRFYLKKVKALFKEGLVDFVASDVHAFRENNFKKAADFVLKKFGKKVYDAVFIDNAKIIING